MSISLLVCKHTDILIANYTYPYRKTPLIDSLKENALRAKENLFPHKNDNHHFS